MQERISVFNAVAIFSLACVSCTQQQPAENTQKFMFAVVNVGQGLSQIGKAGSIAVVWDVGDTFASAQWLEAYNRLQAPYISSIVISHSHSDHMGGMRMLPDSIGFSGMVVTSVFEDTALIRAGCGAWSQKIRFRTIARGDTVGGLDGVSAECIWPPRSLAAITTPISDDDKNRYSLCFIVRCGSAGVCITSDIDTVAEQELSAAYDFALTSDIIVVPHHGSAYSVDPVFYGYVNPSTAIISCARDNPYGQPAKNILDLLYQMRVRLFETAGQGTVTATTDGYYWSVTGETLQ